MKSIAYELSNWDNSKQAAYSTDKNQQTAASAALVAMPGARVRIVLMEFFLDWGTDGEVRP